MKLEMRGQMRLEQKMKLAPHMIQSMEILQLPILALQERIEQELNSNPVLEMVEPSDPQAPPVETDKPPDNISVDERDLVVNTDNNKVEDFQRLDNLGEGFQDVQIEEILEPGA